jgi:hypothetical protein
VSSSPPLLHFANFARVLAYKLMISVSMRIKILIVTWNGSKRIRIASSHQDSCFVPYRETPVFMQRVSYTKISVTTKWSSQLLLPQPHNQTPNAQLKHGGLAAKTPVAGLLSQKN